MYAVKHATIFEAYKYYRHESHSNPSGWLVTSVFYPVTSRSIEATDLVHLANLLHMQNSNKTRVSMKFMHKFQLVAGVAKVGGPFPAENGPSF
ncbi:hypothetical protein CDAR_603011 [Caerostris darwini]|uniref:Uncharacterized protein n=1 Tax=Caerostris darwini TaxID=1538125 RepID=A0AAV4TDF5_9ARAC|nr:hypothetical protein CDAR_603011 [Caerostris darwini]